MVKNITDIIISKWKSKKLAPFYIIRPPLLDSNFDLQTWSEKLLVILLKEHYLINEQDALRKLKSGQSDILFINKELKKKQYTVDNVHIQELLRMQNYSAKELHHRFVFFNDAEDITTTLSNKLLKILEEPKLDTTIFFLNGSHSPMLSTIESRAITLYLPNTQKSKLNNVSNEVKDLSLSIKQYFLSLDIELPQEVVDSIGRKQFSETIEYFTKKKGQRLHLIDAISGHMAKPFIKVNNKTNWLEELQSYKTNEKFNNSYGERVFGLLSAAFKS